MEKKFLTPEELFEDEAFYDFFNPDFVPKAINKQNILFWNVPAFLIENHQNQRLTEITASEENKENGEEGNGFRLARLRAITDYTNDVIFPEFDAKTQTLWVGEPRRDELFQKVEQLIVRSQYNLGYGQSGLYLDFNKLFDVFDNQTPFKTAEKIIDNNLFLGNMATFYTIKANNRESQEVCEAAKKQYIKALNLLSNSDVHFGLPEEKITNFKYVEDEGPVLMKFCGEDDVDDLLFGYGPQFLGDAKLYKKEEKKFAEEKGDEKRQIQVDFEIRKLEEQEKELEEQSNKILERECLRTL